MKLCQRVIKQETVSVEMPANEFKTTPAPQFFRCPDRSGSHRNAGNLESDRLVMKGEPYAFSVISLAASHRGAFRRRTSPSVCGRARARYQRDTDILVEETKTRARRRACAGAEARMLEARRRQKLSKEVPSHFSAAERQRKEINDMVLYANGNGVPRLFAIEGRL